MYALGLIVSLCYVPGVIGAYVATQWPVLSIALPVAVMYQRGIMTPLHWAGLVFVAYAFAHLHSVPIFADGVWGIWILSIMALSFWLGSTLSNLRDLYRGLAIGAAVSSLVGVAQWFGYSPVMYVSEHPAGLYVNSVVQGMTLAFLVVALVSERLWLYVPLLLPGLVLSHSRGAFVALAIGLLAVYVRRVWVFGLLGLIGLIMLFTVRPDSSDELRLLVWNDALHFLTPWGWGPGSFFSWLIPYRDYLIHPEYAHNDAIQLVFEYGIFAAFPIGIFAFLLTRVRSREWPVLVTFVTASCYAMPLWAPITSFLACLVAGRLALDWHLARVDVHNGRHGVVQQYGPGGHPDGGGYVPVVAGH